MALTIAIDINDVIRDYTGQFLKYYKKIIDSSNETEYDDMTEFDFKLILPFKNENGEEDLRSYYNFLYEDCVYEIFCRAEAMERELPGQFKLWTQGILRNFDEDKNPNIMIVSPFEIDLSIQSTLAFLSRIGMRAREYYFPVDSQTIWDKCDILITANPNLILNKPENKIAIKIEAPYNKDIECDYTFESLSEVINDKEQTIIKLIEDK